MEKRILAALAAAAAACGFLQPSVEALAASDLVREKQLFSVPRVPRISCENPWKWICQEDWDRKPTESNPKKWVEAEFAASMRDISQVTGLQSEFSTVQLLSYGEFESKSSGFTAVDREQGAQICEKAGVAKRLFSVVSTRRAIVYCEGELKSWKALGIESAEDAQAHFGFVFSHELAHQVQEQQRSKYKALNACHEKLYRPWRAAHQISSLWRSAARERHLWELAADYWGRQVMIKRLSAEENLEKRRERVGLGLRRYCSVDRSEETGQHPATQFRFEVFFSDPKIRELLKCDSPRPANWKTCDLDGEK